MSEFPPNSHNTKAQETAQPREKMKPVTSAKAERRKRGLGRQFKETFFRGSGKDAFAFAIEDVVVPAIQDTLHVALRSGIERLIYGDTRGTGRPSFSSFWSNNDPAVGKVDYNGVSKSTRSSTSERSLSRSGRARHDFGELLIPSGPEANEVIDRMFEGLNRYGQVSVADLLVLVGIRPEHTDEKWGWTNLTGATAIRTRNGMFRLALPEAEELRR
jgi:hypothetical protein